MVEAPDAIDVPEYLVYSHRSAGANHRFVDFTTLKRIVPHNAVFIIAEKKYQFCQPLRIYKFMPNKIKYILAFDAKENTDLLSDNKRELTKRLYQYLESV